jgi:hypothetical protein
LCNHTISTGDVHGLARRHPGGGGGGRARFGRGAVCFECADREHGMSIEGRDVRVER